MLPAAWAEFAAAPRRKVEPPQAQTRRIGATDIGAICGVNDWRTPKDVFDRLVLGIDAPQNAAMLRGLKVEPEIRRLAVERYGLELEPRNYEEPFIIPSLEHDFATCSPDDFASLGQRKGGVAEYKSANRFSASKYGLEGTDDVRGTYVAQAHWLMAVTGRAPVWMVVAFGADDKVTKEFVIAWTALYVIERDAELQAQLLNVGRRFWQEHILTGVEPSLDWWKNTEAA